MTANIRPYRSGDLDALYAICLATGDAGRDAAALYRDPRILGEIYVAPYAAFEPGFVLTAEDDTGVGGYILGAADTRAFEARLESEWWPNLRARHPDPGEHPRGADERMVRGIHHPRRAPPKVAQVFPAHLHMNLLPRLQGQGLGRHLLDCWLAMLRERGVAGVHLATGPRNPRAMRFYTRHGFHELAREGDVVWFGMELRQSSAA